MNSTAIATINLSALQHNLSQLRIILPKQKIIAMIKSNAYGHGLIPVAKAFSKANALGVATISEALQLRAAGIECDIVVMRGFLSCDELQVFLSDPHLIACLHDPVQIQILDHAHHSNKKSNNALRVWLKIDTGMHRLGFLYEDFSTVYNHLNTLPMIDKSFVVCSHLADADNPDTRFTELQLTRFSAIVKNLPNEKSILNSAGILAHTHAHYDWIRPGLMLYGIFPFQLNDGRVFCNNRITLKPAMTLTSQLIAIKNVKAGEKIGYSCTYTAERDMKIGIVGMGYGDSYPRQVKNGAPVLIHNQRCQIVGRVSMDMITVDISHLKQVAIDDVVTLWGENLLVSEIAACANTISHELLCHLTGRVGVRLK